MAAASPFNDLFTKQRSSLSLPSSPLLRRLRPLRLRSAAALVLALGRPVTGGLPIALMLGSTAFVSTGCATMGLRSAVNMTVTLAPGTPASALVYFDEKYIGPLGVIAKRGVRVSEGKHRITVEKTGYFPVDVMVVSRVQPIVLEIEMLKLPE
jgi:hypothetical protein